MKQKISLIERFLLECRKKYSRLLWFCITTLSNWFKKFAPLFRPIRSKTKANHDSHARTFSRSSHRSHVLASRFDWFSGFSVSFEIGQGKCFGTQLKTVLYRKRTVTCRRTEPERKWKKMTSVLMRDQAPVVRKVDNAIHRINRSSMSNTPKVSRFVRGCWRFDSIRAECIPKTGTLVRQR